MPERIRATIKIPFAIWQMTTLAAMIALGNSAAHWNYELGQKYCRYGWPAPETIENNRVIGRAINLPFICNLPLLAAMMLLSVAILATLLLLRHFYVERIQPAGWLALSAALVVPLLWGLGPVSASLRDKPFAEGGLMAYVLAAMVALAYVLGLFRILEPITGTQAPRNS